MKFMLNTLIAVAALAVLTATSAMAQVATPRLNPVTPEASGAFNPATLPWSGPSRIGLGVMYESTEETTASGTTTVTGEGKGKYNVQARYVGETFSANLEILKVEFTVPNSTQSADYTASMANGAMLLGESISIGVGIQNGAVEYADSSLAAFSAKEESSLTQVGLSVQVVEGFFLSAATGTETLTYDIYVDLSPFPLILADTQETDRRVTRVGLGYFARNSDSGFHVEVFKEAKEIGDFTDNANFGDVDEEDTTGLALEVVFSNILLGFEKVDTQSSDINGVTEEDSTQTVSVGWVPEQGFSITAFVSEEEITAPGTTDTINDSSTWVGVAWLF